MDKNKYVTLLNKVNIENQQHNDDILNKINSSKNLDVKFNSIEDYNSWVNETLEKLGLSNNQTSNIEDVGIVKDYKCKIDNVSFLTYIQQTTTPIDFKTEENCKMTTNAPQTFYQVCMALDDNVLITYSSNNELINANNDFDYICMLLTNDVDTLLDLLIKKI